MSFIPGSITYYHYTNTNSDIWLSDRLYIAKTTALAIEFAFNHNPSTIKQAMSKAMNHSKGRVAPGLMELMLVKTWNWYWLYVYKEGLNHE